MEQTFTMLQQLTETKFTTRDLAGLLFNTDTPTTSQIEMTSTEIKELTSLGLIDRISNKRNIGVYELTEHGKETIKKTIESKERNKREIMEALRANREAEKKKVETNEQQMEIIEDFLRKTQLPKMKLALNTGKRGFNLDFQELDAWSPDIGNALLNDPNTTIALFEEAAKDIIEQDLTVFVINLPESKIIQISKLSCAHTHKLVSVEGVLRNATERYSVVVEVEYECLECGNHIAVFQTGQTIRKPSKCICGKKYFKEVSKSLVDCLKIRIEEDASGVEHQPNQVSGILSKHLAADNEIASMSQQVGSKVRIVGTLLEVSRKSHRGVTLTAMDKLVSINSIEFLDIDKVSQTFNSDEEKQIREYAVRPTLRKDLKDSIAPEISGHDIVKSGLLLQMFSGQRIGDVRKSIHVFLCGDPSTAKSRLLNNIAQIYPKVRRDTGAGATKVGVTATVTRNEDGKYEISAGSLPLANNGMFICDEMLLLNTTGVRGTDALKEPMEQQTVSISKGNVHVTLKAEAIVLGAANPKNSNARWDSRKSLSENVGLDAALLSRFDLIFKVLDIPDGKRDSDIADKILGLSNGNGTAINPANLLAQPEFKKYIAYARKMCKVVTIPDSIKLKIKDKYLTMRQASTYIEADNTYNLQITARQLEGIQRLVEAAARMRLSTTANEEDFEFAWAVFEGMARAVGVDEETGLLSVDKFTGTISQSKQNQLVRATELFKRLLEKEEKKEMPVEQFMEALVNSGTAKDFPDATVVVDRMKRDTLHEPRIGVLRLI